MGKKSLSVLILIVMFILSGRLGSQSPTVLAKIIVPETLGENGDRVEIVEKENIDIDGRHYEYIQYCRDRKKKTIRVISLKTKEDTLIIPSQIEGEPVVEIGMGCDDIMARQYNTYSALPMLWQIEKEQVLKNIVVPEGIKQIVGYGFMNTSAECIVLPKSLNQIGEDLICDYCFWNSKIEHVSIKGSKTNIGGYVFASSDLKKITLPKNYQGKIGSDAFKNSKLEKFNWPSYKSGVTKKIGSGAFKNCTNLKKVTFPKNQKHIYIPNSCFYGCTKLKKLTFPASTKKVTYRWSPYADNYKMGPGILVFKGKKTVVVGSKVGYKEKRKVITVGKIIAPKNSKALAYAKKAKRVKWLAKSVKTDIKRYTGPEVNYVEDEYGSDIIKLAKMKYSILKK